MLHCWLFSRLGVLVQCERKREKKERRKTFVTCRCRLDYGFTQLYLTLYMLHLHYQPKFKLTLHA